MQHTWRKDNWAVSTCTVCGCIRKLKRSLRRNKMKYEYIMPGPSPVTTEEPKCKKMKKTYSEIEREFFKRKNQPATILHKSNGNCYIARIIKGRKLFWCPVNMWQDAPSNIGMTRSMAESELVLASIL